MKYQSRLSRIFFPEKCDNCGRIIPVTHEFCPHCPQKISFVSDNFCEHCAHEADSCFCSDGDNIRLPHVTAVYMYNGDIKERIHAMKFRGRLSLANHFAEAMAKRVREIYPDVKFDAVCFVPMTKKAEKERGYNQSRILAKALSYNLGVPVSDCLNKTRDTDKQHLLTGQERTANLEGAFSVRTPAETQGKTLLLCDDIKTTGATLSECVSTLLSGGAKDVYCVCIAVADYKGGNNR